MRELRRKGQEEIVGFVVVVLLVSIVALIFIGFSIRKEPGLESSPDAEYFLSSAMEYTTSCSKGYESNYLRLGELIEECKSGGVCLSEGNSCIALNKSLSELINSGYGTGLNKPIRGYEFKAVYARNLSSSTSQERVIELKQGDCSGSGNIVGADSTISSPPGVIVSTLILCD